MITIEKPYITNANGKSRLNATIHIDKEAKITWFEVDEKFERYLCDERGDAFVVAIVNYAMCNGHDIQSIAPIGEFLYYQLDSILIDTLANNSKVLYRTKLLADLDSSELPNAGAVGSGISCGIDSFHVVASQNTAKFPKHKLTHLAFNNVGSHGEGERAKKLFNERRQLAKNFCDEYHFEYVEGNSNLQDTIPQNHYRTHTYSSLFSVFALQKLYSIYYYASSGHKYSEFSIKNSEKYGAALYELLSLNCFSTSSLKIYSEGGEKSRFEKVKFVVDYEPSYRYLNVCLKQFHNCGLCEKCIRTLVAIDALNKLEEYESVFNIDYYKKHSLFYYSRLIKGTISKNSMYAGVYPLLKGRIPFWIKCAGFLYFCYRLLLTGVKKVIPTPIKKLLKKILSRN